MTGLLQETFTNSSHHHHDLYGGSSSHILTMLVISFILDGDIERTSSVCSTPSEVVHHHCHTKQRSWIKTPNCVFLSRKVKERNTLWWRMSIVVFSSQDAELLGEPVSFHRWERFTIAPGAGCLLGAKNDNFQLIISPLN